MRVKWGAAIGFFTLINSLSYFYYFVPGSDTYFLNLVAGYLSGGFIYPQAAVIYPWPGFFLLNRILGEVTNLPLNIIVSVFYLVTGFVMVSMLFFMATRNGLDGFWSIVTFSILAYFFVNYQFAPQTLALVLVMILFFIDYSCGRSWAGTVLVLTLVVATALAHSFLLLYYGFYIFIRSFQDRRYLIMLIFAITLVLVSNILFTFSDLFGLVLGALSSIQSLLGLADYGTRIAGYGTSPFVTFAELSVLSVSAVSGLGLIHLVRKRRALPQDIALIIASTLAFGVGIAVQIFGTRALQLGAVIAGIGSGHFPELLQSRKVRGGLLLFLSVSSIFCVMHFNYYSQLYQSQEDAQAARFLSARMVLNGNASNPLRIFTPFIVRGFFGLANYGNASIRVFFSFDQVDPTSMNYILAPVATPAFSGRTYPAAKANLTSRYNIIFSYGDGVIYAAT